MHIVELNSHPQNGLISRFSGSKHQQVPGPPDSLDLQQSYQQGLVTWDDSDRLLQCLICIFLGISHQGFRDEKSNSISLGQWLTSSRGPGCPCPEAELTPVTCTSLRVADPLLGVPIHHGEMVFPFSVCISVTVFLHLKTCSHYVFYYWILRDLYSSAMVLHQQVFCKFSPSWYLSFSP